MSQDNKQVSQKGLNVSVKITLNQAQVAKAYQKHLQKVSGQISVKGFRKSAQALKMREIERTKGPMVRVEVIDQLLQEALNEVIQEHKHSLASRPEVVNSKGDGTDSDVVCQMSYEVFADIPEVDLSKLSVSVVSAEVTQENVGQEIDKLKEHHGVWTAVERASKEGDQLKIDFVGRLDGELFDGGSATDQTIELGSGQFLPDFEKNLKKVKAGDEKTFKVSFPKEYQAENLAGKKASFEVKVHTVSEKKPLETGKKLYELAGSKATKKPEFEKEIMSRLEADAHHLSKAINRKRMSAVLKKKISFPLPESTLNEEIKALQERDKEMKDKVAKQKATDSLTMALLLRHYIQMYKVKASEEDVKSYIAVGAPNQMSVESFYDWYIQDKSRLDQVRAAVIEQNAFDKLLTLVKTKEVKASIQDIEKELKEGV
jgi:trigger factor